MLDMKYVFELNIDSIKWLLTIHFPRYKTI